MPSPKDEEPSHPDEDVYEEDDVEDELENDEINEDEAGFMEGFERDEDATFKERKKKKKEQK